MLLSLHDEEEFFSHIEDENEVKTRFDGIKLGFRPKEESLKKRCKF